MTRTTLNIDDALLVEAERLTGNREKAALVRLGLEALIERESTRRLAKIGALIRPQRQRRDGAGVIDGSR